MTKLKMIALSALAAALASGAAVAQTLPPLTDDIKPIRASGLGIKVADIERSRKFYTEVLGMKVDARVPAQGAASEYLLGFTGNTQADNLIVIRATPTGVPAGATGFGSITIVVPNGRKMAERVKAGGGQVGDIKDGTNIVHDPDGYAIELYQRPAPPAPK